MAENNFISSNRREFLNQALPACALIYAGIGTSFTPKNLNFADKFDKDFPYKLTIRSYFQRLAKRRIDILKAIEEDIGEERLIIILSKMAHNNGVNLGKDLAKTSKKNDFSTYCERFRDKNSALNDLTEFEIVEDSEKVFEMKVTKCVIVEAFIKEGAGKYANAEMCDEDYGHAQGFNSKIKLIRDKTLTLGHNCCNHRYILQD
ncbi:L-2-amino-thiazoline-4-carboxylic acid hydrolase [candidate division KSB1 bacterium]